MGKEKKIIVRKQRCDPTSSSDCTETIICSHTPTSYISGSTASSCSTKSDPKVYLIEATKSSSSSSSSSSSKECRVVYAPRNTSCDSGCGNGCRGSTYYDFCAQVRPVRNFALIDGKSCGELKIKVSINNRTITLQWGGFSGEIDSSGASYLSINQSFKGLPSYSIFGSFTIETKMGTYLSTVEIVPNSTNTIRWYLSPTMKGTNVSQGDSFSVYGGSITYIMNEKCC